MINIYLYVDAVVKDAIKIELRYVVVFFCGFHFIYELASALNS